MIRPLSGLYAAERASIDLIGNRLEHAHRSRFHRIVRTTPSLLTRLLVSFCTIKRIFLSEIRADIQKVEGV